MEAMIAMVQASGTSRAQTHWPLKPGTYRDEGDTMGYLCLIQIYLAWELAKRFVPNAYVVTKATNHSPNPRPKTAFAGLSFTLSRDQDLVVSTLDSTRMCLW